ncbi:TonB-dependent receptor [Arenibacter algicola]|uniref:SusC/RagA family TonB-linked outer membrane protein n=1 Tax=Arenibacter algicola TaxID=616991 RepID=UPI001C06EF6C|nr:TonB-dependent receptor [Arenibacter algicola]MBU2903906.1 TonB-dependent receptor [Arenibacter algicola]
MRIFIFLCCTTVFALSPNNLVSQHSKIKIAANESLTVDEIFDLIMEQTEYTFFYEEGIFMGFPKVQVQKGRISTNTLLKKSLSHANLNIEVTRNNAILISEKKPKDTLESLQNKEFQFEISGTITDGNNQPLTGANILEKGTTNGTQADFDGNFLIAVKDENAVLVISYIGFTTKEVALGGQTTLNVQLEESAQGLEEVVVVGYGVQKKSTLTGSVATVDGDELAKIPSTNLAATLAGQMTGVIVNNRGSSPGSENIQINIRGKNSWQGGSPLIVIDGIANRSGFERINPNDIESISVLKDASAAIYGSRAADGVILITTKRGKDGKPTIEYTGDFGLTQPTRVPEMTRSWQFATYYTEAQRSGFIYTDEEIQKFQTLADPNLYPNFDVTDTFLQDFAPQTTHTLSLRGGNDAIKYYFSGRYLYQESYFKNGIDNFNSYNFRSNLDAQVTDNLKLSADINGRRDDVIKAFGSGSGYDASIGYSEIGFFDQLLAYRPTVPLYYENGLPSALFGENVAEKIKGSAGETDDLTTTLNTQATIRWDLPFITDGLFLEGTAAYDFTNMRTKQFSKDYDLYSYDASTGDYSNLNSTPVLSRYLYDYYYNSYRYTLNGKLGYEKTFGDHSFNTFIAYEQYAMNNEWINATRSSFLSTQIPYQFAGDVNTQKNDGSGYEYAYRNYFGRLAYAYKQKYLLDFTMRRDESLKFPEDNRIGWFPGISVGWRISEEPFVKEKIPTLDNLKLRASYGQMGSDNVGDYQYLATAQLQSTGNSYVLGADPAVVSTLYFSGTPNPNITWEVANSYNVALEGSINRGALGFQLEYFYSKRSNILATRNASVPVYAGMSLPSENIGKAQNQGIELMLLHQKQIGDFSYNISGNFTYTSNEIIFMDESENIPVYQKREAHPIDSYLLYKTDGIFNTQQELDATTVKRPGAKVGDIKYLDVNEDGNINDLDMVRLYDSPIPKVIFGLNFGMEYKGLELSMMWQGQGDAKTYINPTERNGDINIPLWLYNDRWTADNAETATMPRAFYHRSETYNTLKSDFWLKDASFLRLKNLELAYNLPSSITSKLSIRNVRISLSGMNLLLFDKIKDYDPEIVNSLGLSYPSTKVYNVGVRLTL